MRTSSINLLAVGLSLLCFVNHLHSDPQPSSWVNYEPYNPIDFNPHVAHRVQSFSDRYDSPSIRNTAADASQYRPAVESIYRVNQFASPDISSSYPESVEQTKYAFAPSYSEASDAEELKEDGINVEKEDTEGEFNEDEILQKMRVLDKLLSEDSSEKDFDTNAIEDKIISEESRRVAREVKKQKPGFFWTLARITFEAINDTRSAIKQISEMINNNIAPDSATQSTMMRGSLAVAGPTSAGKNMSTVDGTNGTTTTTEAPFVLTRSRLQSLIRRNVLGLVRLFNIEWKDALNQSEVNVREFQKDLGNQVGMYLRDNPDAY